MRLRKGAACATGSGIGKEIFMKKKTKTTIGAIAAAAATTALIATNTATNTKTYDIGYDINPINEYVSEMSLDVPDELSVDIIELDVNGAEADKALLPNENLKAIPLVFTDLKNLEIKLYKRGEKIGVAKFKDNKLKAVVDND